MTGGDRPDEESGGGRAVYRLLAGRETRVALAVLFGGSLLLTGGFVPAYLAILVASGVRNAWGVSLGNGLPFWAVVVLLLYVQAVLLAALYRGARRLYRSVDARGPWSV